MFIITEKGFWIFKKRQDYLLGSISSREGDLRLFSGVVPPWPESIKAKEIAEKLKERYNTINYNIIP